MVSSSMRLTKFLDYIQMPSNVLLRRLRPSRWLAFLMTMWGVVMVRSIKRITQWLTTHLTKHTPDSPWCYQKLRRLDK